MTLKGADQRLLEKIHRCFLQIEKTAVDQKFLVSDLKELNDLLLQCQSSEDPKVQRLTEIARHLVPNMTVKHFSGYLVPVERLLQKKLQDDDFLITTKDRPSAKTDSLPLILVLDNIRSAFNVGSVFRTAECLNIESLYLCGYTPTPQQDKVEKTAMGTEEFLPWKTFQKTNEALEMLKNQGYRIVALETAEKAVDLYQDFQQVPTAFILGNERFGLDSTLLSLADEVRQIPLRGQKNSLNVGITAAVAGFEWVRQWNQAKSS